MAAEDMLPNNCLMERRQAVQMQTDEVTNVADIGICSQRSLQINGLQ